MSPDLILYTAFFYISLREFTSSLNFKQCFYFKTFQLYSKAKKRYSSKIWTESVIYPFHSQKFFLIPYDSFFYFLFLLNSFMCVFFEGGTSPPLKISKDLTLLQSYSILWFPIKKVYPLNYRKWKWIDKYTRYAEYTQIIRSNIIYCLTYVDPEHPDFLIKYIFYT